MLKNQFLRPFFFALLLLILPTQGICEPDAAASTEEIVINTADGPVTITAELALTERQQEEGLMFRTHLEEKHGMLFDFGAPRPVTMWMKNTLIPLDMIFIDNRGVISQIAAKTTPESTDLIKADHDTRAVLEIAGGAAQKYRITINDTIHAPHFP